MAQCTETADIVQAFSSANHVKVYN